MRDPLDHFFGEFSAEIKKAQRRKQLSFILLILGVIFAATMGTWLAIDYNHSKNRQQRLEEACFQGNQLACKMMKDAAQ